VSGPRRLPAPAPALILAGALCGCAQLRCTDVACADDAKITAGVWAQFDQHPELEAPNSIEVHTRNHVVYLTGLVDTPLQVQLAQQFAAEVPGAVRVVNSIGISNAR